jgi:membrane fusion protein (multidrug efflux system)
MKFILNLIVGMILIVAFTSCKGKPDEARALAKGPMGIIQSYPVMTLSTQEIELQSIYPAVLKGLEDIEIKSKLIGYIEAVYVDEGARVIKGQRMFKINSPSSVKDLKEARARYDNALLDLERMRPLAEKKIISAVRIKSYEHSFTSAKAALEQAEASMEWVTLSSPVDGVVGTINYRLGSLVKDADTITTVANVTGMIAYFSMNEKEMYEFLKELQGETMEEKIKNIPDVRFLMPDGSEYENSGRIDTISGLVDQVSGTVSIRAVFPNENKLLFSGTSGKIIIPKRVRDALIIPQKATFEQQDKTIVYRLQGDSVNQTVINVTSTPDGKNYVVRNGLAAGDKIVLDGHMNLSNGQKIKIQ